MECLLCGTINSPDRKNCIVCNNRLDNQKERIEVELVDLTSSKKLKQNIVVVFSLLLMVFSFGYYLYKDLSHPQELVKSREDYARVLRSYEQDPELWIDRKNHFLSSLETHLLDTDISKKKLKLKAIPLEALIAYQIEEMQIPKDSGFAFSFRKNQEGVVLTVSKSVSRWLIFKQLVAFSILIQQDKTGLVFKPYIAKKGHKALSFKEIIPYFSQEIFLSLQLKKFSGGMIFLNFETFQEGAIISLDYLHHSLSQKTL